MAPMQQTQTVVYISNHHSPALPLNARESMLGEKERKQKPHALPHQHRKTSAPACPDRRLNQSSNKYRHRRRSPNIQTYLHINPRVCSSTLEHARAHTHACSHTHAYPSIPGHIHVRACPRIITHTHAYTRAYSRIPAHFPAHARAYSHILAHTRTYLRILARTCADPVLFSFDIGVFWRLLLVWTHASILE